LELAKQIRAERNAEKEQAEQEALTHLLAHRFLEASRCAINYEAKQVFQRGVGIDWKKVDPAGYAKHSRQSVAAGRRFWPGSATSRLECWQLGGQ
jgi:hypothetical protein